MSNPFETMMYSMSLRSESEILDECMSFDVNKIKRIPTRFRIIAVGFLAGSDLGELNEKLTLAGCEKLYARNYKEASLIYAFTHRLSYDKWKELLKKSELVMGDVLDKKVYAGKRATLSDLKGYVHNSSRIKDEVASTNILTMIMNKEIENTEDETAFMNFLKRNKEAFTNVREKTRYYFCKYLALYLDYYIDLCIKEKNPAISSVLGFDIRKIKRASKEDFEKFNLSFSGLYAAFNDFYFAYMDTDWMDILIDYYGDISRLPKKEERKLASSLKAYNRKWKGLSDKEVIELKVNEIEEDEAKLDELFATGKMDSVVRSRSGERIIREYINGNSDINRISLICYILFFGSILSKNNELYPTEERLNEILNQSGFGILDKNNEFDDFIIHYIDTDDKVDYLMDTVTEYALNEKNFYLYHMHYNSYSNSKMFDKFF